MPNLTAAFQCCVIYWPHVRKRCIPTAAVARCHIKKRRDGNQIDARETKHTCRPSRARPGVGGRGVAVLIGRPLTRACHLGGACWGQIPPIFNLPGGATGQPETSSRQWLRRIRPWIGCRQPTPRLFLLLPSFPHLLHQRRSLAPKQHFNCFRPSLSPSLSTRLPTASHSLNPASLSLDSLFHFIRDIPYFISKKDHTSTSPPART